MKIEERNKNLIYIEVECDACGRKVRWNDIVPKYIVVRWLRGYGWSVGRRVLCQQCKQKGGKAIWE